MEINYNVIYDSAYNILDLRLDDYDYDFTVTLEDGLHIDFDTHGRPAAIEMINTSRKFNLLARQFDGARIEGKISVAEDGILLEMRVPQHKRILESDTLNAYDIPLGEYTFIVEEYE